MKDVALLLDGNSLMFRAYHATAYTGNLMQTKDGIYTNALYGFINMLNKLLDTFKPKYLLIAFDKGKQTFRHQALSTYKGTRAHMPEELSMQIPLIKEYIDLLNIKRLELDLYEADDIVGSMAKVSQNANLHAILVSGDKDLLQLVDKDIDVYLTKKGVTELEEYNIQNFKEKMGFSVDQMVDYKALIGDKSDNLEGIPGVGPKSAISLLEKYQTIEGIYNHIDELTPKMKENFEAYRDTCFNTRFLAKIFQDIDFDFVIDDCTIKKYDSLKLRSFFEKLEFNSFIKKMNFTHEEEKEEVEELKYNYHLNDLTLFDDLLTNSSDVYLDFELEEENYHRAQILGISLVIGMDAFFISDHCLYVLNEIMRKKKEIKTIDSKKTIVKLLSLGYKDYKVSFDLLLGLYLINPSFITNDFKTTVSNLASNNLPYFDEIYGKKTIWQIPDISVYSKYAMDKLVFTKNIHDLVMNKMKDIDVLDLYQTELKLADVLAHMEFDGFKIDKARLKQMGEEFHQKIVEIEQEIYTLIGKTFNISSPKQLGTILFDELKLAKGKKNKTGYSTSAEILEGMKDLHPVIPKILDYRKYTKLYSTYVIGLNDEIFSDGKVHTIFKQTLTSTGRLSSTEPNIQNIPIRTEEGKIIRSAFVSSSEDGMLVSADYSQIELRILAQMSKCEAMINDFNAGLDLHTSTAAKIFGVDFNEVTKDMRRQAKAVNFGIIYGMSDWGLADTLSIRPIDAKIFIDKYFSIYPEIKDYLDYLVKSAKEKGYTLTMFNRRRYIPEINSSNGALRGFGERTSMNAPIQGSAADIIKMAMVKVYNKMKELNLKSKMVAQVHDELIIDTEHDEIEIIKKLLKEEMENVYPLNVKLTVDVEMGTTWDLK